MTKGAAVNRMMALQDARVKALERLMPAARAAANVLKDAGHASTAAAVNEALFEVEAIGQEMEKFTRENILELAEAMKDALGG